MKVEVTRAIESIEPNVSELKNGALFIMLDHFKHRDDDPDPVMMKVDGGGRGYHDYTPTLYCVRMDNHSNQQGAEYTWVESEVGRVVIADSATLKVTFSG